MRIFLFILLSVVFGAATPVWGQDAAAEGEVPFDASTLREDGQIIAFVGKKVFVRSKASISTSSGKYENGEEFSEITPNERYEVRYEILDLISGDYDGETIDFYTYNHYLTSRYSDSEDILIFIFDGPRSSNQSVSSSYGVHRTMDGDWAACDNTYRKSLFNEESEPDEPLEPISFLNPVKVDLRSLTSELTDHFSKGDVMTDSERTNAQAIIDEEYKEISDLYQSPNWTREGKIATCQLGTRVQDLYDFQYQTRFLPEKREEFCGQQHANELEALGNDWKARNLIYDKCIARLKIQNFP